MPGRPLLPASQRLTGAEIVASTDAKRFTSGESLNADASEDENGIVVKRRPRMIGTSAKIAAARLSVVCSEMKMVLVKRVP